MRFSIVKSMIVVVCGVIALTIYSCSNVSTIASYEDNSQQLGQFLNNEKNRFPWELEIRVSDNQGNLLTENFHVFVNEIEIDRGTNRVGLPWICDVGDNNTYPYNSIDPMSFNTQYKITPDPRGNGNAVLQIKFSDQIPGNYSPDTIIEYNKDTDRFSLI